MPVWRDASASVEAEWFHTPGIHQGQIRWGPEQPDLVHGLSARGRGVQTDFKGAFQPKLFYDSVECGQARNTGAGGAQGCRAGKDPVWHCPSEWGDNEPPKPFVGTTGIQGWDTHFGEEVWCHQNCSVTRQRKRKVFGHAGEVTDQERIVLHHLWQLQILLIAIDCQEILLDQHVTSSLAIKMCISAKIIINGSL